MSEAAVNVANTGSGKEIQKEKPAEKPPKQSWRYFWSMIRFSPWIYLLIVVLRILIFGIFPQLGGLLLREYFNTLTWQCYPQTCQRLPHCWLSRSSH